MFDTRSSLPPTIILNDITSIGHCWSFAGRMGCIGIKLTERICITSFSLNHAHPNLMASSLAQKAPQAFALWALYPPLQDIVLPIKTRPITHFLLSDFLSSDVSPNHQFVLLVNGSYNLSSLHTHQFFEIPQFLTEILNALDTVVLEILSNWGAPSTCIYSIGVHREPLS
ncbi:hypothetical protein P691DRAFT_679913 [Macrolepiota fuliginosa MF-IS2]|uniref:SUN domain-containing protein n=1 Tax=Macrolepiota fuliginosa MF-IS2 TaxID=1400762 RepID=A0A9P5X416_9AGAR|nr:hypothetical protein P691DRAFT_679913 [Macrolepiota fuliginosa MF-IS2]